MNSIAILLFIIVLAVSLPYFLKLNRKNIVVPFSEGFGNYSLEEIQRPFNNTSMTPPLINSFPQTVNDVLVQGEFPITHTNGITNNGADKIWQNFPTFKLGSYTQITNNFKYQNNPDEGTCMPASMCGTLYKNKQHPTNEISTLPPVNPNCGTRIGYFSTGVNLLPFRTNVSNILY